MMKCIKINWFWEWAIFQDLENGELWRINLSWGHVFLGEDWYRWAIHDWPSGAHRLTVR